MRLFSLLAFVLACGACASEPPSVDLGDYEEVKPATIMDAPAVVTERNALVEHGRYVVELSGCGVCHTDGAMAGEPRMDRWLAGSRIGIAYTNPMRYDSPGVLFPPNLTPDKQTGIGRWSDAEVAGKIRSGFGRHGRAPAPVMPWPAYAKLSDHDLKAIVAYLRSLPPLHYEIPEHVPAGAGTDEAFVYFGVFRKKR